MSPAVVFCTQRCLHCWRVQPPDIGLEWSELGPDEWDPPELVVEEAIKAQRRILTGYKKHPKVPEILWREAWNPNQAAISLSGEPTLYPYIGGLIREFHRRGFTTFLVTNGTLPERLEALPEPPTQLYISLTAPTEEAHRVLCRPLLKDAWKRILRTIDLARERFDRVVYRITLIRGWNDRYADEYAKLIERGQPPFVEIKAYMFVGYSQRRLTLDAMPLHRHVMEFAEELAKKTGYQLYDENISSRVALLVSGAVKPRIPGL